MNSKARQNHDLLEPYIARIAAVTRNDGGAAFKLNSYTFMDVMDIWAFPKYPGRTAILPRSIDLVAVLRDFIAANEQLLREPDCWLGTWIHPHTGDFYLDIATGCESLDEARKKAFEASARDGRNIVAIYNPKRKQTIFL